jgi:hypothetical protein
MKSLLRSTLLSASVLAACGGISGCSNEPENPSGKPDSGKMGGTMDKMEPGKMEPGKMGGAMDKMESGKMEKDKMETGKMAPPMDKMEKGKME